MHKSVLTMALATALFLPAGTLLAEERLPAQEQLRLQEQEGSQVYGSQLMTEQERNEYRNRMRNAASAEEREQIRLEHHEQMRKRAEAQGLSLPEVPPEKGGGMGPGGGMGGRR